MDVWGEHLDGLAQGECEVDCPCCGVDLFLVLGSMGDDGFFSCSDDYALEKLENAEEAGKAPLRPADPLQLDGHGRRLHDRALADGQPVLAHRLLHLFGQAVCTDCGTGFSVVDRLVASA
ncbi:hypothetical protein GCM10010218_15550 [Streptomyces mashuensis]|uniref:Uncharacterized protein n=1 Tax=Streptomyces mashuensis TaxID=33904 RepID=A0A919B1T3_9ACTN|nr:hypothetical protein [Streptomyces mashuensis]GHF35235.1 hypothetical protein GCM10010218_15550 [Streptomyces mashuensis]